MTQKGKPMPERTRISNARKSKVHSAVEHVFAHLKGPMGLVVRTIGIARAKVKIGMPNLAYNMPRFVWLSGKYASCLFSFGAFCAAGLVFAELCEVKLQNCCW